MHIHRTLFNKDMVAPDLVQQLGTAVHALGVLHQIVEQLELCGADFEQIALPAHAVGRCVQHQLTHADLVLHLLGRAAAQHGANAGQ